MLGDQNNMINATQKRAMRTMTPEQRFDHLQELIRKTFLLLALLYPVRKPLA
jgi:hypothetical protein